MSVKEELELIQQQNDGLLRPIDIVQFAENPETALHSQFTWDDQKAGYEYRLWQAREIIRVNVEVIETRNDPVSVRAFVSLPSDRKNPGGGYRGIRDVMADDGWRKEMLAMAAREMKRFQDQYQALSELSDVFTAMEKARKTIERKVQRKAIKAVAASQNA